MLKSGPRLVDLQHKQMKKGRSCKIGNFLAFLFLFFVQIQPRPLSDNNIDILQKYKNQSHPFKILKGKTLTIILSEWKPKTFHFYVTASSYIEKNI